MLNELGNRVYLPEYIACTVFMMLSLGQVSDYALNGKPDSSVNLFTRATSRQVVHPKVPRFTRGVSDYIPPKRKPTTTATTTFT